MNTTLLNGFLVSLALAAEGVDTELLGRVRTAHAAAAAALVPMELSYESRYPDGKTVTGTYLEDRTGIRSTEDRGKGLLEAFVKEGRCLTIFHMNRTANVNAYWASSVGNGKLPLLVHFFRRFSTGTLECAPVDVILAGPHQMHVCSRERLNGQEMVRLEVTVDTLRYAWWLDPSVNYLVRRSVTISPSDPRQGYTEVKEFKDLGDGVYMPMEAHMIFEGQAAPHRVTRVLHVRVGQPIAAEKLQLTVPVGYRVWDRLVDKGFVVAPDGTWQEERMPPVPTSSKAIATRPLPPPAERPQPTAAEPESWTTWLVSGSVGLVVAGLVLLGWRRLHGEH